MTIEKPQSKQPIPINAKKVFQGIIFDVYQWEQKLFDGTVATFEKLKRPDIDIVLCQAEQPIFKIDWTIYVFIAKGACDVGIKAYLYTSFEEFNIFAFAK